MGAIEVKRSGIKRNKRVNRVSPQRAVKREKARELYCDSKGIPFHEANSYFPGRVPVKKPDVDDPFVCDMYHTDEYHQCWLCMGLFDGWNEIKECHHIVPRSDEPCNICVCCRACHTRVQDNPDALPEVLRAKVTHDKMHTDWRRIIELRGKKFLFDSLD